MSGQTRMARPGAAGRRRGDEGVALIVVVLFIALLSALVVEFAYEMEVEATFVENNITNFQALMAAKSGVAAGLVLLAEDLPEYAQDQGDYDSLIDSWALGVSPKPLGDSVIMQCRVSDEYGKINLNALLKGDESMEENELVRMALESLFAARGAEEGIVDAIVDWIDPDDEVLGNGAEAEFYTTLELPYGCKNAPMDSLEELLLVRGMTPELFFGDPDVEDQLPLTELLTVHGDKDGKVNINTAQPEVVEAICSAMGQEGLAQQIISWQEGEDPVRDEDDAESRGLIEYEQRRNSNNREVRRRKDDLWAWSSRVFRVQGQGLCDNSLVRIDAFVWRDVGDAAEMFRVLDWRITQ